jgi:hypothetical protein
MALTDRLTAIGDAIREKNGTTELIPLVDMPQAILDISGGGTETVVEYIESTGSQYIDTGVIPNNHRVKIKFQCATSDGASLFGSYGDKSNSDNYNVYELVWYSGKWYYAPNSRGVQGSFSPTSYPTDVVELDFNTYDNKVIMNGTTVATTSGNSRAVLPLYLFEVNGAMGAPSKMKLWYAQIYDRDTQELVRDFVPAVDENGVICLYDNVTKAYFYNQSEGEFIGEFVESELAEIENLIDESGVLEDTEGTVTEKVEELVDELGVFRHIIVATSMFYEAQSFPNKAVINLPNALNISQLCAEWDSGNIPIVDELTVNAPNIRVSTTACMSRMFINNHGVKKVILNVPNESQYMQNTFDNAISLEEIVLNFSTKNIKEYSSTFSNCKKLNKIIGVLDFSSATKVTNMFFNCANLEEVRFEPNTLSISTSLTNSSKLSAESKQSIFDGLATVETAQTITFHKDVKILQAQVDSANAKGWTVAGGTVVSEEEYYG